MSRATYDPMTLASKDFAEEFKTLFDKYIALRVDGTASDLAVIEAFELIPNGISLDNVNQLGMACDVNPYVKEGIKRTLAAADLRRDLWPQYRAAHSLIKMVEDPRVRDSTRLNAINSLNILCGYVQFDGDMQRKIQHSIADFERQHREYMGGQAATH